MAEAVFHAGWFECADDPAADGSAHVPRRGPRPLLLLYFAAPSTAVPSAGKRVGLQ
jgi:hypothetical protein